jgi:hypothetical protein
MAGAAGITRAHRTRTYAIRVFALALLVTVCGGLAAWWAAMFSLMYMDADRAARATEFALIQLGWDVGRLAFVGGVIVAAAALIVLASVAIRARDAGRR